jgi:hypothetical protein
MRKQFLLMISVLFLACAAAQGDTGGGGAVESAIHGVPVPAGSVQEEVYDGGDGIVMAFYGHPGLEAAEVLRFFETQMPIWGWTAAPERATHPRQRSFERDGVPLLVGVEEAEGGGARFSILSGARGDWGFMPQLREPH